MGAFANLRRGRSCRRTEAEGGKPNTQARAPAHSPFGESNGYGETVITGLTSAPKHRVQLGGCLDEMDAGIHGRATAHSVATAIAG